MVTENADETVDRRLESVLHKAVSYILSTIKG